MYSSMCTFQRDHSRARVHSFILVSLYIPENPENIYIIIIYAKYIYERIFVAATFYNQIFKAWKIHKKEAATFCVYAYLKLSKERKLFGDARKSLTNRRYNGQ